MQTGPENDVFRVNPITWDGGMFWPVEHDSHCQAIAGQGMASVLKTLATVEVFGERHHFLRPSVATST